MPLRIVACETTGEASYLDDEALASVFAVMVGTCEVWWVDKVRL